LKIDYRLLKIDFSLLSFPDVTVTAGCWTIWAAVTSDAAIEAGGGKAGLQTDWTHRLNRPPPQAAQG